MMNQKKAMAGIEKLKQNVDALIVIENDKLLKINSDNVTIVDAFKQADNTLKQGIVGITDLLNTVGEINIDFADISTIISIRGLAYMGIGSAIGENALAAATRKAIDNPLTAVNINGAKGIIINIQGSKDLSLSEINSSVAIINDIVDEDANIIFGTVINEDLGDEVKAEGVKWLHENYFRRDYLKELEEYKWMLQNQKNNSNIKDTLRFI